VSLWTGAATLNVRLDCSSTAAYSLAAHLSIARQYVMSQHCNQQQHQHHNFLLSLLILTTKHFFLPQRNNSPLQMQVHIHELSSVRPPVYPPVCLSICLSVCLSIYLTPSSTVLLTKPTIPQPLKKFLAFYRIRKFITVLTKALQLSLSCTTHNKLTPPPPLLRHQDPS